MNTPAAAPPDDGDFEAEVTALGADDAAGAPPAGRALFGTRLSAGQRARRAAGAVLTVVVTLAILLAALPGGASGPLQRLLSVHSGGGGYLRHGSRAVGRVDVCKGCYYIVADVPWAAVTLDGQPQRLPTIGRDQPLVLAPGRHTLVWQADPFPPETCRLSGSDGPGPFCLVFMQAFVVGQSSMEVAIVRLPELLSTVPPSQRGAALAVLRHAEQQQAQQYHSGGDT